MSGRNRSRLSTERGTLPESDQCWIRVRKMALLQAVPRIGEVAMRTATITALIFLSACGCQRDHEERVASPMGRTRPSPSE